MRTTILLAILLTASGCMHLKGIVEEAPDRPATTAALSVGRPGGITDVTVHHVNAQGRFDFWIFTIDEHRVFLFDTEGELQTSMRRIDRSEFGNQMRLTLPSGRSGNLIHERH